MRRVLRSAIPLFVLAALLAPVRGTAQSPEPVTATESQLTRDQMREFLLTAKVIKSRDIGKGVTRPMRLTLTDGTITHDGAFQSIDEKTAFTNLRGTAGVGAELDFVDAYRYNLAAEILATAVGLEYMMPVHVERRWQGRVGALSWWVDTMMDEGARLKRGITPPNPDDWNNQMYRMRVFAALTRDTDRNLGNVLITREWKIMMIDFTRAFRLQAVIANTKELLKCDRELFARLKGLTSDGLKQTMKDQLAPVEIEAVLKRRDMLVAHFESLIRQDGERAVLY